MLIRSLTLLLALLAATAALALGADEELLEPEKAFQFDARSESADSLIAEWTIAPGYYLYRDKFSFVSETPGVALGEPHIPSGQVKHDEFFGEVEIFRNRIRIEVPIALRSASADAIELKVVSQGCADLGVCYPPLTQRASLELPTTPSGSQSASSSQNPLQALAGLASSLGGETEILHPDEAFVFSAEQSDDGNLIARWRITPGYYLYRDKFEFTLRGGQGVELGTVSLPPGEIKDDEFFGRIQVYKQDIEVPVPLITTADARGPINLVVKYQGCAEAGVCYPPQTKESPFKLTGDGGSGTPSPGVSSGPALPAGGSEQDRLASFLLEKPLWLSAGMFFLLGIGLAFTPCVFPMIPILSGIIIGQGTEITTRRAFTLSLVYVLAMALTYTIAGVVVALLGANLQIWFQDPWVLGTFAAVFVLLSLSMFGFYELQVPTSIQSRLSEISNRQGGGTLIGVGIMGFLSALIVGPCITAPLVAALLVIGQAGDPVLGATALFALSMGMGAPLLAIGTSAGKLLPRAGAWMDAVKAVFGVLLLAVAIWLVERVLPTAVTMALWAILLIVSAIYLGALDAIRDGATGWHRLWKGVGVVLLLYGALLLVGAAAGGRDVLQPLKGTTLAGATATGVEQTSAFRYVKGPQGLDQALREAASQSKPVMLDFYADWCVSCKEMEKYTFSDPRVQAAWSEAILLKTDVTANDAQDQALLKRFGLFGPPAILFFTPEGDELRDYRVVGFVPPERFSKHVHTAFGGI
jgi:thiol:disulfide interchange protein DsbD